MSGQVATSCRSMRSESSHAVRCSAVSTSLGKNGRTLKSVGKFERRGCRPIDDPYAHVGAALACRRDQALRHIVSVHVDGHSSVLGGWPKPFRGLILDWLAAAQLLRRDAGNFHDLLPQGQFAREPRLQCPWVRRPWLRGLLYAVCRARPVSGELVWTAPLRRSTISPGVLAGTSITVYVSSTKPG